MCVCVNISVYVHMYLCMCVCVRVLCQGVRMYRLRIVDVMIIPSGRFIRGHIIGSVCGLPYHLILFCSSDYHI